MNAARSSRGRLARRTSAAALLAAWVLTPASATAASAPAGDPNLSPRLAELAMPVVLSAPRAEQAARLSLAASGPGSLLRDGNRVLVDVRFDSGAAQAVDALRAAGAEIVHVSGRYQTVTVATKPADLPALGEVARVGGVTEVLTPVVRGADCGGSFRSEGDAQLHADNARASFGVDGSGVTVGILSDSFDRDPLAVTRAAGDVATGDLPGPGSPCGSSTPVGAFDDSEADGGDEGRAMAQIVHDLAPGATIDFATAFTGELQFAANIRSLAVAGARVIADDVSYYEEPFFQDGPVAAAVNDVANAGVSYFSAAGNDNLIDAGGRNIASWEAPEFRDGGICPSAIVVLSEEQEEAEREAAEKAGETPEPQGLHPEHCMDFNPDPEVAKTDKTFGITVDEGATLSVDLQWAEPWHGVRTDLDAFLLEASGELLEVENEKGEMSVVASAEDNIGVSQKPVEVIQWENDTEADVEVQLAINQFEIKAGASQPRLKFALLENGRGVTKTDYPESAEGDVVGPTLFGHSGASGAISTAAVRYNTSSKAENFSSRGPVKHYFGPVLSSAAAPATGEQVISKPDLAATDGGANTFFGLSQAGIWRFFGTSASAPHAAAVAALVRQANPGASAAQVRSALTETAHAVGASGADVVGVGLIDAFGAVERLALPPTVTITKAPEPLGHNRRPMIEFTANRPVAFSCQIDGGVSQPCASPYSVPTALSDGSHGIVVSGTDIARRVGTSGVASFVIDTKPPRTTIAKHPPKLMRTHRRSVRGKFRFRSNEAGATFVCKVDRGLLRFCGRRFSRRFGVGKHTVQVRARDLAGNVDRSPAVFHFRVKRVG